VALLRPKRLATIAAEIKRPRAQPSRAHDQLGPQLGDAPALAVPPLVEKAKKITEFGQ